MSGIGDPWRRKCVDRIGINNIARKGSVFYTYGNKSLNNGVYPGIDFLLCFKIKIIFIYTWA